MLDKQFFSENGKSYSQMKKNNFSYSYLIYQCSFIGFDYFSFNFSTFLKFWGNPDIQEDGSKMAGIWQLLHNYHLI